MRLDRLYGRRHQTAPDWLASLASKVGDGADVDVIYGSFAPVVDSFFKECAAMAYLPPPVEIDGHRLVLGRSLLPSCGAMFGEWLAAFRSICGQQKICCYAKNRSAGISRIAGSGSDGALEYPGKSVAHL